MKIQPEKHYPVPNAMKDDMALIDGTHSDTVQTPKSIGSEEEDNLNLHKDNLQKKHSMSGLFWLQNFESDSLH